MDYLTYTPYEIDKKLRWLGPDIVFTRDKSNFNLEEYEDFLKEQEFQEFYNDVSIEYNCAIEDDYNHGVPMMNDIFYGYYNKYGVPPTWEQFIGLYLKKHVIVSCGDLPVDTEPLSEWAEARAKAVRKKIEKQPWRSQVFTFSDDNIKFKYNFTFPQISRKLMNGYMSFLKEVHCLHWLWENGFGNAFYSLWADYDGMDICLLSKPNYGHCLRMHSYTKRSDYFLKKKDFNRTKIPSGVVDIQFAVAAEKDIGLSVGDTFVASQKAYEIVAKSVVTDERNRYKLISYKHRVQRLELGGNS